MWREFSKVNKVTDSLRYKLEGLRCCIVGNVRTSVLGA